MATSPSPVSSDGQSRLAKLVVDRAGSALILAGLLVVILFVFHMLAATEAHFTPQLVDLYVVLQYARAMAEGHPFQYNPGEPPSTGATSLLLTIVLAAAHGVGVRGEGLVAFAVLMGAGFYLGAVVLARRVGTLLAGPREGLLAGALVAFGGPVVWGFLYGSDVGLFMVLSLWLFERTLSAWPAPSRGSVAAAILLALARPEGLPIALAVGAAWSRHAARHWSSRILPWLPACAGLAVLGLNRALTGGWLGTSVSDKSLIENYGTDQALALLAEYVLDVTRGLLLGFYPSQVPLGFARGWSPFYFPPLALAFILVAASAASLPRRTALHWWLGTVAVVFLLSANVFMGVHFNRYLMWAFPSLLAVAAAGLGLTTRLFAASNGPLETALFRAAAGLAITLAAFSTLRFAIHYGDMAGEVYRKDVAAARWIMRNLPPGVRIANLATSVEYLTGHRNMNLHGVTNPSFFGGNKAERDARTIEALGRLEEKDRPPYLISSVSMQEASPAFRELVKEPPLFASSALADEVLIFEMRYDSLGRSRSLFSPSARDAVLGLLEVDRLNLCDSQDEAAHQYARRSAIGNLRLHGTARVDAYVQPGAPASTVIDSGRAILGEESFRVRCRPGRELTLVMRTAREVEANILRAEGNMRRTFLFTDVELLVHIDGVAAGTWNFRPSQGWNEVVLRIPPHLVRTDHPRLRLVGRYGSFYYWFFQPAE